MTSASVPLVLRPVEGPVAAPIELVGAEDQTIGRGHDCRHFLPDERVSRRHARLARRGANWMIEDLGSRHGTHLNDLRLDANQPAPLEPGDVVRIGPWAFRVELADVVGPPATGDSFLATIDDRAAAGQRIRSLADDDAGLARHQLKLFMDCAAALGVTSAEDLAQAMAEAARHGTGFEHAAVVRLGTGDRVEVLGFSALRPDAGPDQVGFSRSLLRAAQQQGVPVELARESSFAAGVSIAELGISAALCVPVRIGDAIAAHLYLDARDGSREIDPAAVPFSNAIARLLGAGLANLRRQDLERRSARLEAELSAAHRTQRLIVPARAGARAGLRWAVRMQPGRFLAGDLFDLIPLADGRVAICIGDVTGEGVDAAVIMTATQSHLHAALEGGASPGDALVRVNRWLVPRSPVDRFVTLWLGLLDPRTGALEVVDAGHGHWAIRAIDGSLRRPRPRGGIPLGIDAEFAYVAEPIAFAPGERLLLYTDGLLEQRGAGGARFETEGIARAVATTTSPEADVESLLVALEAFAAGSPWDDDVTVASVGADPDA